MYEKSNTKTVPVKFPSNIVSILNKFSTARGENRSTVIRRLVYRELAEHSYLDMKQKKALGVNSENE